MPKTLLELAPEQRRAYTGLSSRAGTQSAVSDDKRAWAVARLAARLLRDRFGATRVVVFGSLVDPAAFSRWSDIDMAVWGVPAPLFYRAVASVSAQSPEYHVDLVSPEDCRPEMRRAIEREGVEL